MTDREVRIAKEAWTSSRNDLEDVVVSMKKVDVPVSAAHKKFIDDWNDVVDKVLGYIREHT